MQIIRKKTHTVYVDDVPIGGDSPITIQSMTNTDTKDIQKTITQIKALEVAGCEIVRVAVPDKESALAIKQIKAGVKIPVAADVQYDHRLALLSMESGADKLRINPGTIGSLDNVAKVVKMAKERNVPMRIGVNAGSLEKHILQKYGSPTPEALLESALGHVSLVTDLGYDNIVLSLKASSVPLTIEAYKLASEKTDFPLHVGITEAGTISSGKVKSAVGIGTLLYMGIGDTIRVSLTGDPVEEIYCAKDILQSLNIRKFGIDIISCPTCGRTKVDLVKIATQVETLCKNIDKNLTVAIMGCAVNGPGEAREADVGIAAGNNEGLLFKKGEIMFKVPEDKLVETLMKEIESL